MKKLAMLISILLLTLFVVACGNETDDAKAASDEKANNTGNTEENTDTGTEEEPAEAKTITIKHELGEATVSKNPEKVVVFDMGTLDSLDKLGVEVTAVPKSNLPSYLSKYEGDEYINAGSLFEPDFEALSELDPDVIFISGRQSEVYEDLNELAPTVFLGIDTTRYLDSFKENSTTLGEIFGKESEVEAEVAKVEDSIAELNEQVTAEGKNGLIILTNDGNINAYGPGSRFGIIHDQLGFTPVDENIEASTHGQNIAFEYILEKDPEYLFVIDRNMVVGGEYSAETTLDNKLVNKTQAAKNDNIIYLNPEYWYVSGGGLISVSEMIKEVAEQIK